MNLLCRGRLKLLVASLTAIVLLTWLYLLAGNFESECRFTVLTHLPVSVSENPRCIIFMLMGLEKSRPGLENQAVVTGTENLNYQTFLRLGWISSEACY